MSKKSFYNNLCIYLSTDSEHGHIKAKGCENDPFLEVFSRLDLMTIWFFYNLDTLYIYDLWVFVNPVHLQIQSTSTLQGCENDPF